MITLQSTQQAIQRRRLMTWLLMHRPEWESQEFSSRSETKRILFSKMRALGYYNTSIKWEDSDLERRVSECRAIIRQREEAKAK